MEPQQQQQQLQNQEDVNGSGNGSSGKGGGTSSSSSGYVCRQSSTRWTPTTDQIRILKDLYYNYGVRSPTADQIQRISSRLRQYGKIEGKNVFYWFQNHKARERQKKRFFSPDPNSNINGAVPPPPPTASAVNPKTRCGGRGSGSWSGKLPPPEDPFVLHNKYSNLTPTGLCSSSSAAGGVMAVGQMGGYGYGSVTMEKDFRDCSISAAGGAGSLGPNLGWIAVDGYASPPCAALLERKSHPFLENRQEEDEEGGGEEEEEAEAEEAPEIETLPLFPMHGNDHLNHLNIDNALCNIKPNSDHYHHHIHRQGYWYEDVVMSTSRTSLELSLNSYAGQSPGPI